MTGASQQKHLDNLKAVFDRLLEAGFRLNLDKCVFFQEKVKYLGHVIDKNGLHKDDDKVSAILNAPRPTTAAEVKAYAGLINYYGRFFPNLASVLSPFYQLLKKDGKFKWTTECEKAYITVKKVIASDNVLTHYNPKLPIKLICDASQNGIGAAIFHVMPNGEELPIAFASKTLSPSQQNYSTIDREALAIYFGVNKYEHYLLGRPFIIQSDHKPLITIFGEKKGIPAMAASRLQRWAIYLSNFDFKIEHISGQSNVNADF